MGECTRQTIGKTEGMEQREPVHPQLHSHCVYHDCAHCGLCALTTTTTNTRALCLLERTITQFLWDGGDGNRRCPMVDGTTLAWPHVNGGVNCLLVKHIAHSRRVSLWTHALCSTDDWACALMKQVMDETGANATAFLHKHIVATNHAHQIMVAFKWLRWAYPDNAIPHPLKEV